MNRLPTPQSSTPDVRLVVRASLRCPVHSSSNRRHAQSLVRRWVNSKFPRLATSAIDMDRRSEYSAPGQALSVVGEAGSASWTLSVASTDPKSDRAWMTTVQIADAGDADVLDIHTSCTDKPSVPIVVAPPSVLRLLVRNLDLDDGGIPIIGEARAVEDTDQARRFCDHVCSSARTLPIIALAPKSGTNYYGVDPAHLADALSGLAHVAYLGSPVLAEVAELLDPDIAPVAGAAQIYEAPSNALTPKDRHSLIRQSSRAGDASLERGHLKRMLIQRACALSAGASKDRRRSA